MRARPTYEYLSSSATELKQDSSWTQPRIPGLHGARPFWHVPQTRLSCTVPHGFAGAVLGWVLASLDHLSGSCFFGSNPQSMSLNPFCGSLSFHLRGYSACVPFGPNDSHVPCCAMCAEQSVSRATSQSSRLSCAVAPHRWVPVCTALHAPRCLFTLDSQTLVLSCRSAALSPFVVALGASES
jgi:hypothetical protein